MSRSYPSATAKISAQRARLLGYQQRVGRYMACAVSSTCFDSWLETVELESHRSLSEPTRLLSLSHLCNAVNKRLDDPGEEHSVLIEGTVSALIELERLCRLTTISRSISVY